MSESKKLTVLKSEGAARDALFASLHRAQDNLWAALNELESLKIGLSPVDRRRLKADAVRIEQQSEAIVAHLDFWSRG